MSSDWWGGCADERAGFPLVSELTHEVGRKAGGRALASIAALLVVLALLNLWMPLQAYLFIKAVHVVSIIAWMAGLLYLPRLFVYHSDPDVAPETAATFTIMERRLLKVIMMPAMLLTWILGLWLGVTGGWFASGLVSWWLWAKIALVLGLTASHVHFAAAAKRFGRGANEHPPRHWRMVNEVPTLLMIAIVVLVIVVKDW